MSQISEGGYRTLSAFFDSQADAERAVDRLVEAGVSRNEVRLVPGYESDTPVTDRSEQHRGFFGALSEFFFPDEDRYTYAEGLSRGGYLVVLDNLSPSLHDTALDILDDEGSVDLDQREESWRSEGWSGYSEDAVARYGASAGTGGSFGTSTSRASDYSGSSTQSSGLSDTSRTISEGDSETIPVVDERLVVGKRDVNQGRVRVRSYVREEPVSADVSLHNERVTIDRRPVDRPLTDADAAFRDRTIEAEEHREEAVVGKEARVTEEISLRKEGDTRTETVSDTVRKTDVEIEDERDIEADRINRR
jgi:uncharacterized protein (TIGR02271 family)